VEERLFTAALRFGQRRGFSPGGRLCRRGNSHGG